MQWIPIQMHLFHELAHSIPVCAAKGVSGGDHKGGSYNGRSQEWPLQAARKEKESEESMLWL
jgi:hypothetical protein